MYTWGYIKENTLGKLNLSEDEANELGLISRFSYYANEAMTQICGAIKPNEKWFDVVIDEEHIPVKTPTQMPDDFISFSDSPIYFAANDGRGYREADDTIVTYSGYNEFSCNVEGEYKIPYNARWFFFTRELTNETIIPAPADICDALPSYIASQCFKIDDEVKSAIYRNEYEMFLARMDNTSIRAQKTFHIGGGW